MSRRGARQGGWPGGGRGLRAGPPQGWTGRIRPHPVGSKGLKGWRKQSLGVGAGGAREELGRVGEGKEEVQGGKRVQAPSEPAGSATGRLARRRAGTPRRASSRLDRSNSSPSCGFEGVEGMASAEFGGGRRSKGRTRKGKVEVESGERVQALALCAGGEHGGEAGQEVGRRVASAQGLLKAGQVHRVPSCGFEGVKKLGVGAGAREEGFWDLFLPSQHHSRAPDGDGWDEAGWPARLSARGGTPGPRL